MAKTLRTEGNWRNYFSNIETILACPVAVTSNNQTIVLGTATFLTPGMFFTAKHVIEDTNISTTGNKIEIYQMLKGNEVIVWEVDEVFTLQNYDVSLLLCNYFPAEVIALIKDHAFGVVPVDLHAPTIGDQVRALGYPFPRSRTFGEWPGPRHIHAISLKSSYGKAEEIYYQGVGLVKSPCFQTNAAIDRGMSGGPVINKNGSLCGIVSSGFEPTDDSPFYTAFVSLLAQAFILTLDKSKLGGGAESLLEYTANNGYPRILGAEHIRKKGDHFEWHSLAPGCRTCDTSQT